MLGYDKLGDIRVDCGSIGYVSVCKVFD
jgi:hypothetical protein